MALCRLCSKSIPSSLRADAIYCSKKCRDLAYAKRYHQKYPGRSNENHKRWRLNNLERAKALEKAWRERNPEKLRNKEKKRIRIRDPEKVKESSRKHRAKVKLALAFFNDLKERLH